MLSYSVYKCVENSDWVTFIHGAGGSSSIWYKQLREFRKHFNVLLLDLRGHGKSKFPINDKVNKYSFERLGNDVIEVLDHLKIEKTHFVGISLGTIIIRDIAERFPGRAKSMVLGGAVMKINFKGQILMKVGSAFKSVIPYLILYRLFAHIIMPKRKHRESRNLFINEAKKLYQREFKRWFSLVSQINPLLSFFRIKDSGVHTLYIMGSEDHMFLPSISKLVSDQTSSLLHVVRNCGHVVNVEKADEFNFEVIRFIKTVN